MNIAKILSSVLFVSIILLSSCAEKNTNALLIAKQGSFAVGGTVVHSEGQTFHGDHAYVFYQIPANVRRLPIRGNTHFPFSDLNNVEIADLMSAWLKEKGLDEYSLNKTNNMESSNTIFPKGDKITNNNFNGTAYLQMLMTDAETFDCTIGNVTFEPGCRNSWHSHPGGQILLVTSGEGYYQEKGKPIRVIKTGDIVKIMPNVVHWHGATPDSGMEHIAIGTQTGKGAAVWLEPVTDGEYNGFLN